MMSKQYSYRKQSSSIHHTFVANSATPGGSPELSQALWVLGSCFVAVQVRGLFEAVGFVVTACVQIRTNTQVFIRFSLMLHETPTSCPSQCRSTICLSQWSDINVVCTIRARICIYLDSRLSAQSARAYRWNKLRTACMPSQGFMIEPSIL